MVPDDSGGLVDIVERILTSSIRVEQRRKRVTVEFVDPDGILWLRSRQRSLLGRYKPSEHLEDRYPPAFHPRTEPS